MKIFQIFFFVFLAFFPILILAQKTPIHRDALLFYSDYYGKLDSSFTSEKNSAPLFSLDSANLDLAATVKVQGLSKWYWERLLNKSWYVLNKKDYSVTIDPYYHYSIGKETVVGASTWTNKRGFFINAKFGSKIRIHSYLVDHLSAPDPYIANWINSTKIMPGESEVKFAATNQFTNMFSAGGISYEMNKFMDLTFAHGKIFLGDGYRSVLLSDAASAYPYARINLHFGKNVNYSTIVAEFVENKTNLPGSGNVLRQKKYTSFHYLDIKLHKKLYFALSETVIWGGDSSSRNTLEVNYLNPFIVMRPTEYSLGSMDKMQIGTNIKYLPFKFSTLYGQFLLTEYYEKELFGGKDWWGNKYAFQVGAKFHNFSFIKNLFLQLEYNQIRPFTYAHRNTITSFSHMGQPLAHPAGGNLKESLVILNYRFNRWNFNWKSIYRISGLENTDSTSIGTDVQRSYDLRESEYGNVIGQGISYSQWYNSLTVSYLINPANMMFFEGGVTNRQEKIGGVPVQNNYIFLGIKTGFLNTYHDF